MIAIQTINAGKKATPIIKVKNVAELLREGFKPEGSKLVKGAVSIEHSSIRSYQGMSTYGELTGDPLYPFTIDGILFPADAVSTPTTEVSWYCSRVGDRKGYVFADGSVFLDGKPLVAEFVAAIRQVPAHQRKRQAS